MNNRDAALSWCERNLSRNGVLQRDGVTWLCSSPTREDKHPSLSVDVEKRVFKDFATGEAGTLTELSSLLGVEGPAWEPEESREGKIPSSRAKDASGDAARLWKSGKPAQADHPYLVRKRINPNGCREVLIAGERTLLVPAYNEQGILVGCERVWSDGRKMHLGEKAGCFHLLGVVEAGKPIVLTEGFSTGAAVHEATGYATVVCFGAAGVSVIAKRLREKYPDIELVAATDADPAGEKAAAECPAGTLAVIPNGAIPHCDWCDVAVELGPEEAARQFEQKLTAAREKAPLRSAKKPVKWEPKVFTAKGLYSADIPEREWAVDDLVPAGLSVLASPPKMGKSWMALQMCLAVANGTPFLGMKTHKGPVLYVSLEDSPLRLRKRIAALVGDMRDIPANLHLMTELPRLDKGGMEFLEGWIQANKPRLVCLDTWGKVKPGGDAKKNAFDADYSTVAEIKMTADRYAVALNLVHHLKKGGSKEADFLESLNGSMGLPAAADAILALKRTRGENTAILQRSGRDIEHDDDLALTWEAPGWKAESVSVAEVRMSEERRDIIKVIRDAGEPVSSSYVAESLGKNRSTTKNLIRKMVHEGVVNVSSRGQYYIPSPEREKNDDDESVVSVVPVVRCSPRSLRSPDGPETTADYGVVQSVVQSESSTDAGLEAVSPAWTTQTTADYDKGQNFSEVKRMGPDELVFLPCEKPGSGSLPRVESEPAYDPFAVLGL